MTPMSLQEFARMYHLDATWIELRLECNRIVEQSDFWYRKESRDLARELALKASDILSAAMKNSSQK